MLDSQKVHDINMDILRACLTAHGRRGFSGDLRFRHSGGLAFWNRTDVYTENPNATVTEADEALRMKWTSIAVWLNLPQAELQVFFQCGKITKAHIQSEHREQDELS
jgi:hypothetical protein